MSNTSPILLCSSQLSSVWSVNSRFAETLQHWQRKRGASPAWRSLEAATSNVVTDALAVSRCAQFAYALAEDIASNFVSSLIKCFAQSYWWNLFHKKKLGHIILLM